MNMKAERKVKQYTLVTVLSPFCSQFFKNGVLTKHLFGSPRQNIHIFFPNCKSLAKVIFACVYYIDKGENVNSLFSKGHLI